MDELGELRAIEEIKQLKARYCRLLDTKQWEGWRGLFSEDARFEGTSSPPDGGPDEFVATVRRITENARTAHYAQAPEIELRGDDRARGIWALHDYVEFAEPRRIQAGGEAVHGFLGYGHYEEEYSRGSDGWQISFLRLTRLRLDPLGPVATLPIEPPLLMHSTDWLG